MKFLIRNTLRITQLAGALSAILTLVACTATPQAQSESSTSSTTLEQAIHNNIDSVLPDQASIKAQKNFPYLIASPKTEHFDAQQWSTSPGRVPATLIDHMNKDASAGTNVNHKCSIYEQLSVGLFSTPAENSTP